MKRVLFSAAIASLILISEAYAAPITTPAVNVPAAGSSAETTKAADHFFRAGILATTVGVLPFMVSYDPKVTAFAASMNLPTPPGVIGMTANRLFENFMGYYKDRERHLATIERRREEMVKLAQANINLLFDFIKV